MVVVVVVVVGSGGKVVVVDVVVVGTVVVVVVVVVVGRTSAALARGGRVERGGPSGGIVVLVVVVVLVLVVVVVVVACLVVAVAEAVDRLEESRGLGEVLDEPPQPRHRIARASARVLLVRELVEQRLRALRGRRAVGRDADHQRLHGDAIDTRSAPNADERDERK